MKVPELFNLHGSFFVSQLEEGYLLKIGDRFEAEQGPLQVTSKADCVVLHRLLGTDDSR